MASFLHHFHPVLNGTLFFEPMRDCVIPVEYYFDSGAGENSPSITLRYRWRGTMLQSRRIRLEKTRTNFDGWRWWFGCPECDRRIAYLYLPTGAENFACRSCHGLTYRSAQEAHREERFLRKPIVRWMFARVSDGWSNLTREQQPQQS
jgi:hypothetical protein